MSKKHTPTVHTLQSEAGRGLAEVIYTKPAAHERIYSLGISIMSGGVEVSFRLSLDQAQELANNLETAGTEAWVHNNAAGPAMRKKIKRQFNFIRRKHGLPLIEAKGAA